MKKRLLIIASLLMFSLLLVGCTEKSVFNEKSMNSYTVSSYLNDTLLKSIKKQDEKYIVTDSEGAVKYYMDFGNVTYEYTTYDVVTEAESNDDTTTTTVETTTTEEGATTTTGDNSGDNTEQVVTTYAQSETSTVELSDIEDSVLNIKNSSIKKDGSKYVFQDLVKNTILEGFMHDVYLDDRTELYAGYSNGLITLSNAYYTISGKSIENFYIEGTYNNQNFSLVYKFSEVGSTSFTFIEETYLDKVYVSQLDEENAPVITLNFKNYGKVEVKLFKDLNSTLYFIYLLKNNFFDSAKVDAKPSTSVFFGTNSKKTPDKTIATTSSPTISNKRGVLSLVVLDSDDKNTSQLVLNFGDNSTSYNKSGYAPIGGVISGFSVMDKLSGLTSDEYANVEVKITIKYNGFVYTEPTFES